MVLRERYRDLQGLGVQAVGVSVDSLPSLRVFDAAMAQFPFPLASDWLRGICREYGVLDEAKQTARRVLVLADSQAIVRHVVEDFRPEQTARLDELIAVARHFD